MTTKKNTFVFWGKKETLTYFCVIKTQCRLKWTCFPTWPCLKHLH